MGCSDVPDFVCRKLCAAARTPDPCVVRPLDKHRGSRRLILLVAAMYGGLTPDWSILSPRRRGHTDEFHHRRTALLGQPPRGRRLGYVEGSCSFPLPCDEF